MRIDAKDARILNLVQMNNNLAAEDIGKAVSLALSRWIKEIDQT